MDVMFYVYTTILVALAVWFISLPRQRSFSKLQENQEPKWEEVGAIRSKLQAMEGTLEAHKTRINSLQGLVNRKLGREGEEEKNENSKYGELLL